MSTELHRRTILSLQLTHESYQSIPFWYRLGHHDLSRRVSFYYPFPLNLPVRLYWWAELLFWRHVLIPLHNKGYLATPFGQAIRWRHLHFSPRAAKAELERRKLIFDHNMILHRMEKIQQKSSMLYRILHGGRAHE